MRLNIFTYCNGIYRDFAPIFILSNLYHNNDCFVEVAMDDANYNEIKESLNVLSDLYKNKFYVYSVKHKEVQPKNVTCNLIPNTIRFILTPINKSDYVYISDIDIITLEKNIIEMHIDNMVKNDLPYSNIVRSSSTRLTGLHFTPYENYYPIPDYSDLCRKGTLNHDEVFLYELVKKKYPNFKLDKTYRPVHGIHVSPNREPEGIMNWGMKRWKSEWINFRNSDNFLKVEPTFSDMIKSKIKIIDNYYK